MHFTCEVIPYLAGLPFSELDITRSVSEITFGAAAFDFELLRVLETAVCLSACVSGHELHFECNFDIYVLGCWR